MIIKKKRLPSGTVVGDPKLVNYAFLHFYLDLYNSEYSPEICKGNNPLEMITIPKLRVTFLVCGRIL